MKFKRNHGINAGIAATACLVAATLLSACTPQGSSYVDQLKEAASSEKTFALPQINAPVKPWEQIAILCPYAATSGLPSAYQKTAKGIDTGSSEGSQWLLFRTAENVEALQLSRDQVDFCASDGSAIQVYEAASRWEAQKKNSTWTLRPLP